MEKTFYGRFRISYNFIDPQKDDNILSIGCKEAEFESLIVDEVKSITAFDINREIINRNNEKKFDITFEHGDIVQGADYPDNSFDKIIFLEVLEHLPENTEIKALKECFRLLKPGGTMVASATVGTAVARRHPRTGRPPDRSNRPRQSRRPDR